MTKNLSSELKKHLNNTEILLWTGKPKQGIVFRKTDLLMIPFSLVWGGFSFFWQYSIILTEAPFFFKLFGIPFVLIGLYLIFGRFILDLIRRKNTTYGITEHKIIIKFGTFKESINLLGLKNLNVNIINEKPDRSGSIILNSKNEFNTTKKTSTPIPLLNLPPVFEMIKNVRNVHFQITSLQKK